MLGWDGEEEGLHLAGSFCFILVLRLECGIKYFFLLFIDTENLSFFSFSVIPLQFRSLKERSVFRYRLCIDLKIYRFKHGLPQVAWFFPTWMFVVCCWA